MSGDLHQDGRVSIYSGLHLYLDSSNTRLQNIAGSFIRTLNPLTFPKNVIKIYSRKKRVMPPLESLFIFGKKQELKNVMQMIFKN